MRETIKGEEIYYFREKRDIAISFRQAVYLRLLPRIAKTVWYGQTMVAVIHKMFHWSYLQIFKSVKLGKTSIRQKSNLVIMQQSEAKRSKITSIVFL